MAEPDPRAAALAELYSAEADGYREVYGPLLLPFHEELLDLMALSDARRILDLGAGPGVAIASIRAAAPCALVVAADRSTRMIALAPADSPRVALDAMGLPFLTGTFDAVTMAFMAFHLPDPCAGFAEAARVLGPGGQLGVATWGTNETLGSGWGVWEEELDRLGAPEGVGSCALGLPDYRSLGTEADLARLLEGAGFRTVAFAASRWTYRPTYDGFMTFMSRHVVSQRFDGLDADGSSRMPGRRDRTNARALALGTRARR